MFTDNDCWKREGEENRFEDSFKATTFQFHFKIVYEQLEFTVRNYFLSFFNS